MQEPANSCALDAAPTSPPAPAPPAIPELAGRGLRHAARWFYHPYTLLAEAQARHGNTFYTHLPSLGRVLVTGEPHITRATISNGDLVGGRGTRFLRPLLGEDTLIILEGEAHRRRHKLLAPHFRQRAVRHLDALTLARCEQVLHALAPGDTFTAAQLARDITLPLIVRLIFGELDDEMQREAENIVASICHAFENPLFLFLRPLQFRLGGLAPWGRLVKHRARLNDFIDARLAAGAEDQDGALLACLARALKENAGVTRTSIHHEILSLLLFGHDTSAVTLAWLFYHVYRDPRVLDALAAELEDMNDLTAVCDDESSFLAACVRESMRLCPVVVHLTRVAVRDTEVADIPVRQGQAVLPSAWLAQHNASIYSQPEHFDPWRYLQAQAGRDDNPYAFFPFGLGARKCIGEPLAMRQLKLILASAVHHGQLELLHHTLAPTRQMLLIGPRGGTPMRRQA